MGGLVALVKTGADRGQSILKGRRGYFLCRGHGVGVDIGAKAAPRRINAERARAAAIFGGIANH